MSTHYILLAVLMLAVTDPARARPLGVPGAERLPVWARPSVRLSPPRS
jgi:hypothetical protein